MTPEEAGVIVGTIRAAYPRDWSDETRVVYIKMIADLDYQLTSQAVLDWIATSKWLPTIADIRMSVAERVSLLPTNEEALAQLQSWMSRQCKDAALMHPLVKEAAMLCGDGFTWRTTDRYAFMVKDFRDTYTHLRKEHLVLEANVKPQIQTGETYNRAIGVGQTESESND